MDDYSITSLTESKNEWCARLVSILTHCIIDGVKSIFEEAVKLCVQSEEENKYLMTFQNLLSRIPQWNPSIIEAERKRIEAVSGCKYLEDLVTCVHIIQLKALTCIRVGQKQKKIDIDIPSIDKFIHQIYICSARKLYTNIYLFERDIYPLQIQKNNRELDILIKEAILTTIRDNVPVEQILRAYIDETEETDIIVEEKKEIIPLENKKVKSIESSVLEDKENNIKSVNDSLTKEVKIENDTPTMENITNEIKEIDQLLNNTNSSEELVEDANEINIDTEIGNLQSNEKTDDTDDKVKITDEINDLPIDLDTLNSDIEDLELEIDELP